MSILNDLASAHGRRDEDMNVQLAQRLAQDNGEDVAEAIQELADNLNNKNKQVRNDCIKVLYEVGALSPELIADYVDAFMALLSHKDNRLVWGGMTALGTIASLRAQAIWEQVDTVIDATANGSVITQDWGVRVLATLSAENVEYGERLVPFLLNFLEGCRPKDVARHAESIEMAMQTPEQQAEFHRVLEQHQPNLKASQLKRVKAILKRL